jgi:hypothetical protein
MTPTKMTKIVTIGIIPAIIIAILIYDAIAIELGGTEASISNFLIIAAYKRPFMVYCIGLFNGILVGHLFWRMKPNTATQEIDK